MVFGVDDVTSREESMSVQEVLDLRQGRALWKS